MNSHNSSWQFIFTSTLYISNAEKSSGVDVEEECTGGEASPQPKKLCLGKFN